MASEHHSRRTLIIALIILGCFFVFHFLMVQSITRSSELDRSPPTAFEPLPNFAAITDIKARKKAFFDYLRPMVEAENTRIKALRKSLATQSQEELVALAELYNIDTASSDIRAALLKKVDTVPTSLVLAQAAIESAWGTSRFAQQGNNLFGEWCFSKGCGMVPKSRNAQAKHEVRRFNSAAESIHSYMRNLNSHAAYDQLRAKRAQQRAQQQAYNGCFLATGLTSYSQKGQAYVEMVKSFIRGNGLEKRTSPHCKATVIAKPTQKTDAKKEAVKTQQVISEGEKQAPTPETNDEDAPTQPV